MQTEIVSSFDTSTGRPTVSSSKVSSHTKGISCLEKIIVSSSHVGLENKPDWELLGSASSPTMSVVGCNV